LTARRAPSARHVRPAFAAALAVLLAALAALGPSGCAMVPQNRRKHLADPMMSPDGDALLTAGRRKLYTSR